MVPRLLSAAAILMSAWQAAPSQSPVPAPVPYETFCQQESMEKRRTFQSATPEHKALLFRTQVERFRDANQARLTADQLTLLKEMLTFMVPATFTKGAMTPDMTAKLESVEGRMIAAFSKDDMRILDQFGPCIAKKVVKWTRSPRGRNK